MEKRLAKNGLMDEKSVDAVLRDELYLRTVVDIAVEECTVKTRENDVAGFHPTLIQANSIDQADRIYQELISSGRIASSLKNRIGIVTSKQTVWENEAIIKRFRTGSIDVVIAVDMLTESLDVPRITHIIKRPTRSVIQGDQVVGRGLRIDPDNPNKVLTVFEVYHTVNAEKAGYRTVPQLLQLKNVTFGAVYRGAKSERDNFSGERLIISKGKGSTYQVVKGSMLLPADIYQEYPELSDVYGRDYANLFFETIYPELIRSDRYVSPIQVSTNLKDNTCGQFILNRKILAEQVKSPEAFSRLEPLADAELLGLIAQSEFASGNAFASQILQTPLTLLAYAREILPNSKLITRNLSGTMDFAGIKARVDYWVKCGLLSQNLQITSNGLSNPNELDRYFGALVALMNAYKQEPVLSAGLEIPITEGQPFPDVAVQFGRVYQIMIKSISSWASETMGKGNCHPTLAEFRNFLLNHRYSPHLQRWTGIMRALYHPIVPFLSEKHSNIIELLKATSDSYKYLKLLSLQLANPFSDVISDQLGNQIKLSDPRHRYLSVTPELNLLNVDRLARERIYRLAGLTEIQIATLERFQQSDDEITDVTLANERNVSVANISQIRRQALRKIYKFLKICNSGDQEVLPSVVSDFLALPQVERNKKLEPLTQIQRQALEMRYNLNGQYGPQVWRVPWKLLAEVVGIEQAAFFSRLHKAHLALEQGYTGRKKDMLTLPGNIGLHELDNKTIECLLEAAGLNKLHSEVVWYRLGCHNDRRTVLSMDELARQLKTTRGIAINRMNDARAVLGKFILDNGINRENLDEKLKVGRFYRELYYLANGVQLDLLTPEDRERLFREAGLSDHQAKAINLRLGLDDGSYAVRDWETVAKFMNSVPKTVSVWGSLGMKALRDYVNNTPAVVVN